MQKSGKQNRHAWQRIAEKSAENVVMMKLHYSSENSNKRDKYLLHFFRGYAIMCKRYAPVAQLDRVTGYEPVGQGFESLQARHEEVS